MVGEGLATEYSSRSQEVFLTVQFLSQCQNEAWCLGPCNFLSARQMKRAFHTWLLKSASVLVSSVSAATSSNIEQYLCANASGPPLHEHVALRSVFLVRPELQ